MSNGEAMQEEVLSSAKTEIETHYEEPRVAEHMDCDAQPTEGPHQADSNGASDTDGAEHDGTRRFATPKDAQTALRDFWENDKVWIVTVPGGKANHLRLSCERTPLEGGSEAQRQTSRQPGRIGTCTIRRDLQQMRKLREETPPERSEGHQPDLVEVQQSVQEDARGTMTDGR